MYATVRRYSRAGELVDALVENESTIRDLIGGINGFHAYYLVRTDDGGAVTVSIFDDRAGADTSNGVAAGWIAENLPDLGVGAPEVSMGDVVIAI